MSFLRSGTVAEFQSSNPGLLSDLQPVDVAPTPTISTKDEGVLLSNAVTTLNFVGAGVTAAGAGATTTVTIPGGGSTTAIQEFGNNKGYTGTVLSPSSLVNLQQIDLYVQNTRQTNTDGTKLITMTVDARLTTDPGVTTAEFRWDASQMAATYAPFPASLLNGDFNFWGSLSGRSGAGTFQGGYYTAYSYGTAEIRFYIDCTAVAANYAMTFTYSWVAP